MTRLTNSYDFVNRTIMLIVIVEHFLFVVNHNLCYDDRAKLLLKIDLQVGTWE